MNDAKIVFTMPDGTPLTLSVMGETEFLHRLAAAIRDRTLKAVRVETTRELYERTEYDLTKP